MLDHGYHVGYLTHVRVELDGVPSGMCGTPPLGSSTLMAFGVHTPDWVSSLSSLFLSLSLSLDFIYKIIKKILRKV